MGKFVTKRNDTKPIGAILQRRDTTGAFVPADLTGGTVRFLMRRASDGVAVVAAAASITDPISGLVSYGFAPGDTAVAGDYDGEFEFTGPGGVVETFPAGSYIRVSVIEDLG